MCISKSESPKYTGYHAGHPWYYLLGGAVHTPKQILELVKAGDYRGYAYADIKAVDEKHEPKRSEELREFREKFRKDLKRDLAIYRRKVFILNRHRENQNWDEQPSICNDIHTAMSLKFSHLINDFAHLIYLDELLSRQADLFDF